MCTWDLSPRMNRLLRIPCRPFLKKETITHAIWVLAHTIPFLELVFTLLLKFRISWQYLEIKRFHIKIRKLCFPRRVRRSGNLGYIPTWVSRDSAAAVSLRRSMCSPAHHTPRQSLKPLSLGCLTYTWRLAPAGMCVCHLHVKSLKSKSYFYYWNCTTNLLDDLEQVPPFAPRSD